MATSSRQSSLYSSDNWDNLCNIAEIINFTNKKETEVICSKQVNQHVAEDVYYNISINVVF
jgi:hypothetical protein